MIKYGIFAVSFMSIIVGVFWVTKNIIYKDKINTDTIINATSSEILPKLRSLSLYKNNAPINSLIGIDVKVDKNSDILVRSFF